MAIPDRLEEAVGEAEHEQVLYRLLAEEVIDPENLVFTEVTVEDVVELDCTGEITPERFLDHETTPLAQTHTGERGRDLFRTATVEWP